MSREARRRRLTPGEVRRWKGREVALRESGGRPRGNHRRRRGSDRAAAVTGRRTGGIDWRVSVFQKGCGGEPSPTGGRFFLKEAAENANLECDAGVAWQYRRYSVNRNLDRESRHGRVRPAEETFKRRPQTPRAGSHVCLCFVVPGAWFACWPAGSMMGPDDVLFCAVAGWVALALHSAPMAGSHSKEVPVPAPSRRRFLFLGGPFGAIITMSSLLALRSSRSMGDAPTGGSPVSSRLHKLT